jgi:hypothetical protein
MRIEEKFLARKFFVLRIIRETRKRARLYLGLEKPNSCSKTQQLLEDSKDQWESSDIRVMYQGFIERGFSNTEDQAARFAALLGHQPRTYSSVAEELAKEWAAA